MGTGPNLIKRKNYNKKKTGLYEFNQALGVLTSLDLFSKDPN
jgi:hypothetical protein